MATVVDRFIAEHAIKGVGHLKGKLLIPYDSIAQTKLPQTALLQALIAAGWQAMPASEALMRNEIVEEKT